MKLSAVIFVDDTDLLHMDMTCMKSIEETHEMLQSSVTSWGSKLIATGGSLKLSKCFYYLIDYEWIPDSNWRYYSFTDIPSGIKVPDGSAKSAIVMTQR